MINKNEIIEKAYECGFRDIGFTTADPFETQKELLQERYKDYEWAFRVGLDLIAGTDPKQILPQAKTIIVLMEVYFSQAFPASLERHFGRCYLDDDRITKDRLAKRIKAFRGFLKDSGIDSKVPFHLPHRVAAARAGLGTFGLNGLLITRKGCAHFVESVVCDVALTPTPRTYDHYQAYCPFFKDKSCRKCIERCLVGAISEKGRDILICRHNLGQKQRAKLKELGLDEGYIGRAPTCGLCMTNVPCEDRIP